MVSSFSFGRLRPTAKLLVCTMVSFTIGDSVALFGSAAYLYARATIQGEFTCGEVHGWFKPTLKGLVLCRKINMQKRGILT